VTSKGFLLVIVIAIMLPGAVYAREQYKIVTAFERGAFHAIGIDLGKYVAGPAGIDLEAVPTKGSADNVRMLRYSPDVKLALLQADVYEALDDEARSGNGEAAKLIDSLRVVTPLYVSEVTFIARADSPLRYIHEIKNSRINVGPVGSGSAMTAVSLYRLMFGTPIPEKNMIVLSHEEALVKLISDKTVDVVVVTSGQPAKLFTEMKPEVKKYIKLLKRDDTAAEVKRARTAYVPGAIRKSSYPKWLEEDVPTFAMGVYLVTFDYQVPETRTALTRFARSLCENLPVLQREGHPKWREVDLSTPVLSRGWKYYEPTEKELHACNVAKSERTSIDAGQLCTVEKKVLGLCQ